MYVYIYIYIYISPLPLGENTVLDDSSASDFVIVTFFALVVATEVRQLGWISKIILYTFSIRSKF